MPNNDEPKSESPEAANIIYSVPPSNPGTPVANPSVRAPEPALMAQTENRPEAFLKPALPITDRETHHGLLTSVQAPVPKQLSRHRNLQDSGTKQKSIATGKLCRPTKAIGFLFPERDQENHQSAPRNMFDLELTDGDKSSSQELPDLPSPKRGKNQETKGLQTSKSSHANRAVLTENDQKNMSLGVSDPLANWPKTGVQQAQPYSRSNGKSPEVRAEAQHVEVPGQKLIPRQEPLITDKHQGQESSPESSKKRKRDAAKRTDSSGRPPEQDPARKIPGDKRVEDQSTSMEQTKPRPERARKLSELPDGVDTNASILKHMTNSEKLARRRADVVTKALSKERELSSKLIVHASSLALHPALKSAKSGSPLATSITESKEKRPTKLPTTALTSSNTATRAVSFAEKPTEVPRGELTGWPDDSETSSGSRSPPVLKSVIDRPGTPFKSSSRKKRQISADATKKAANGKERVADQPSPKKSGKSGNTVEESDSGESSEPDYEPPALKGNSGPSRIGKTSAPLSGKANVSEMKSLSQGTANAKRKEPETSVSAIQSPAPVKGLKAGQPTILTTAEASKKLAATSAATKTKPSPPQKSSNALQNGPPSSRSSTTPSESSSNEEEEEDEEPLLPAEVMKKATSGTAKENSRKSSKESASESESTSDEEDEQSSSQAEDIKQSMETLKESSRASSDSSSADPGASLNKDVEQASPQVGAMIMPKLTATAGPLSKVPQRLSSPESETSSEEEEDMQEEERDPDSKVDQQPPQVNALVENKTPAAELPEGSSRSPTRSPGREVLSSESEDSEESEEEDRGEGKKEDESEDESESESESQSETMSTSNEAGEPKLVEKVSHTPSNTKDENSESESESEEDEDSEDESSEEEDTEDVESKEIKPSSQPVPSSSSKNTSVLGASSTANVSKANGTIFGTPLQAPSSLQSVNAQSSKSKRPEAKKDRTGTASPDEAAKQLQREASQSQNYSSPMSSQSKKPTSAPANGVPSANKSTVNGKRSNALPSLSTMKAKLLSSTLSNVSPTVKLQIDDPFSDASESDDSDDSDEESDSDGDDGRPSKIEPTSSASNNVSSENKKYRALMKGKLNIDMTFYMDYFTNKFTYSCAEDQQTTLNFTISLSLLYCLTT